MAKTTDEEVKAGLERGYQFAREVAILGTEQGITPMVMAEAVRILTRKVLETMPVKSRNEFWELFRASIEDDMKAGIQ